MLSLGFLSLMIQQVMVIRIWERRKLPDKMHFGTEKAAHQDAIRQKLNLTPVAEKVFVLCPRLQVFCNELSRRWILPVMIILNILCFSLVYLSGGGGVLDDNSPGLMAVATIFSILEFLFLFYSWRQARNAGDSMELKFFLQFTVSLSLF